MKTDTTAPDIPTVEAPLEGVNDLETSVDWAVKLVFGTRIPSVDHYKLLGLKERIATLQEEFHEDGCGEADQVLFDYRYIDQPALNAARFNINDALRRISGKESPCAGARIDRRKTFVNQRERLLIRYFHLVQSRHQTGALMHPELHDRYGNVRMTLADVNKVLFGECAKRLSKDQFTAAWKSLWRNEVARVARWTGYRGNIRWVRVDWERWHSMLVDPPKAPHDADEAPVRPFRRELSASEIEGALARLHSRPLRADEEPEQVLRIKKLRISDPFADRWFDIQCWVHNRTNPWFFKQAAHHEVRGQAFEPLIKTCWQIFNPTRKGKLRGPTYTNRTRAPLKLISAKELCTRANITARQLRYEMSFINWKRLGVRIERVGRDLLAISLQPEDLYHVRNKIDTWKRQVPSDWDEPAVLEQAEFDFNEDLLVVNRADNGSESSISYEIDVPVANAFIADAGDVAGCQIASADSRLKQLKPVPGSDCSILNKEGATKEIALDVPAERQSARPSSATEFPAENAHSAIDKKQAKPNPGNSSDAARLARFYGDDEVLPEDEANAADDFRGRPWDGWLPPECREIVEMLRRRLRLGECITNAMVQNIRKLCQLPNPWRLTSERLLQFLHFAEDSTSSVPFWLRVARVEQLVTVSTWKYALRVTRHEMLLRIEPQTKTFVLRRLAFADLSGASARDIGMDLVSEDFDFSPEELQLFGRDPRRLLLQLRMQAVDDFYCDPATFGYEDLRGDGPEEAALMEEVKGAVTYNYLQELCRVPEGLLKKKEFSDPGAENETPVSITPAPPQTAGVPQSAPSDRVIEEPANSPAEKQADLYQVLLPSPPPLPEKWHSPQFPIFPAPLVFGATELDSLPEASRFEVGMPAVSLETDLLEIMSTAVLCILHSRFTFNNSERVLRAIESLASLPSPWNLSEHRLRRYFALWDDGKLPETCKTRRITRLLHPHYWRRVATYVNYYPG